MKHFSLLILIFLVSCKSTQTKEVRHFASRCAAMSPEDTLAFSSSHLPIFRTIPEYPPSATTEGYVRFEYDISTAGEPVNIHVVESYPADTFAHNAREAFSDWRFNPVIENNQAVVSKCHSVQIGFELEK